MLIPSTGNYSRLCSDRDLQLWVLFTFRIARTVSMPNYGNQFKEIPIQFVGMVMNAKCNLESRRNL